MQDLDVDKLLGAMNSPEFGKNTQSIMDMLGEANKVLGRLQQTMNLLDSMGLKPLLVRAAGDKLGIDAETPLRTEKQGIIPQSTYHRNVLAQMNSLSEDQLGQMLSTLLNDDAKKAIEEPSVEVEL